MPQNIFEQIHREKTGDVFQQIHAERGASTATPRPDVSGSSTTAPVPRTAGETLAYRIRQEASEAKENVVGAVKRAGQMLRTVGEWEQDIPRQVRDILAGRQNIFSATNAPTASPSQTQPSMTTAKGRDVLAYTAPGQRAGGFAVDVASFALPSALVGKGAAAMGAATAASKLPPVAQAALNVGTRAGLEAAGVGAMTALQTGDVEATKSNALLAGAIPVAGAVTAPVARVTKQFLSEKLPGRLIESLIKPAKALKKFGAEPGQEVAVQGLKANTIEGLQKEVSQRKNQIGAMIDATLSTPQNAARRVPMLHAVTDPIDDAIRNVRGNDALISRLQSLKEDILVKDLGVTDPAKLRHVKELYVPPLKARQIKTRLGKFRWSEDPLEGSLNDVKQEIYRKINANIDTIVPGTKALNRQYTNLLKADIAIDARIDALQKLNLVGLTSKAITAASTIGAFLATGDLGRTVQAALMSGSGIAVGKVLSSTPILSRVAAQFAQLSPAEKTAVAKAIPLIRNAYLAGPTRSNPQEESSATGRQW